MEAEKITTVCSVCKAVLKDGGPNAPVSHGIGRCCWDEYRQSLGLKPKPYPTEDEF
jgi:hypothetical protein